MIAVFFIATLSRESLRVRVASRKFPTKNYEFYTADATVKQSVKNRYCGKLLVDWSWGGRGRMKKLKDFARKCLRFLKKCFKLKSVDENPNKHIKITEL